mgnify:CR=1 FL=1
MDQFGAEFPVAVDFAVEDDSVVFPDCRGPVRVTMGNPISNVRRVASISRTIMGRNARVAEQIGCSLPRAP